MNYHVPEQEQLPFLPVGWGWVELDDVLLKVANGISEKQNKENLGIPVTRIETISQGIINLDRVGYLSNVSEDVIEKYKLITGDVLFSNINSDLHLGKTAVFKQINITLLHGMNLLLLRPNPKCIIGELLNYICEFYRYSGKFLSIAQHAVNQSSINQTNLKKVRVPLPPLLEQNRIVLRIEELLSYLENGVASLERARANLKRYRASVLKAAIEGKLTEDWRAKNPPSEPASQLLERILTERRRRWEEKQLVKFAEKGRTPPKNWKGKYKEPVKPDTTNLPSLPNGWCWVTVEQLASWEDYSITDGPFGSNLKTSHYTSSGPRVIRLQNIGDGKFIDERAYISKEHYDVLYKHHVDAGDIVIALLGDNLPRACIIPDWVVPAIVKADCVRFSPNRSIINPKYLIFALNASQTRKKASTMIQGVGRPRLNLQKVKSVVIPLPPVDEQDEIVSDAEQKLSIIEGIESQLNNNLQHSYLLRQAILKRAFEGKLVPQDPNDEPASVLLERIKAEREANNVKKTRKPARKKAVKA